jgi:hypothetical protein
MLGDACPDQETDRELVLRFFAMLGHMGEYRMPLSNFLNDEADRGIRLTPEQLQQRRELFEQALSNVRTPGLGSGLHCTCLKCS